jgi:uncharacterized protein YbjT (DUF2867 family)
MGEIAGYDHLMKRALIAGASGLVGSYLLDFLLASDQYFSVVAITRSELPSHAKLNQLKIPFEKLDQISGDLKIDDVFCCLGTTMAKAHSKENFYKVDFHYPLALANEGLKLGATKFLLVSALGADKKSSIFYNRVKGETEEAISSVGFQTVHIVRPSLLLGPRKESRAGEDAAKFFYKYFGFLIPKKYKGIESIKVAKAMIHFATQDQKGIFIHESEELQTFSG